MCVVYSDMPDLLVCHAYMHSRGYFLFTGIMLWTPIDLSEEPQETRELDKCLCYKWDYNTSKMNTDTCIILFLLWNYQTNQVSKSLLLLVCGVLGPPSKTPNPNLRRIRHIFDKPRVCLWQGRGRDVDVGQSLRERKPISASFDWWSRAGRSRKLWQRRF